GWGGNMNVEGPDGDKNFCNTFEGATLTFKSVHVHEAGAYKVMLPLDWATANQAAVKIEVTDAESNVLEASGDVVSPRNNFAWEKLEYTLDGVIADGVKNIKFSFTPGTDRNWAFNMKAPEFVCIGEGIPLDPTPEDPTGVPEGWMSIPGEIDIEHSSWKYDGLRIENNNPKNVGWAKNGCSATGEVYVKEAGVYNMNVNFNWFANESDFQIEITDQATGIKEINTYYHITGKHIADILLEGVLTPGKKTIKYTFHSESSGYLANYINHSVTKVGESYAALKNIAIEGLEPVKYEGYDYSFNIPMDYSAETIKVKVDFFGGSLKAAAGETELPVSDEGMIAVPTPAPNEAAEISLSLLLDEGAYAGKTDYKVRLFHIGDIILSGITLDGLTPDDNVISALNEESSDVSIDGFIFTSLPEVIATFLDGSSVKAYGEMTGDNTAKYEFQGVAGNVTKDYSFNLSGLHVYRPSENDKTDVLKFDSGYKGETMWSNGLYSISCNDGWDGSQFKMKSANPVTLTTPSDMKIKQMVMACLRDNYVPGKVASVTSEGATVYLPSASAFQTGVDNDHSLNLVINVENHVAGTPFVITFEGGSQPVAWFEFIYETVVPEDAPVLEKTFATSVEDRNHAVVSFQFNRAVNGTAITVNGKEVTAYGGTTTLSFPLWDLPYNSDVEVTIPAGAVSDTYGNHTDKAYTHVLSVGSPAVAAPIPEERFVVANNVEKLRAAVEALKTSNCKRDDPQTVIFLPNGDYDLEGMALGINNVYNVALIGESQEGVVIHGLQTGISNPVVSTRYSANILIENLTIRNDLDFGKADRVGVGVAHYGGELDILKNVSLQSIQDTEVTGERGYWNNVTIHGSVDYICGGGDHFFDHCTLMHEKAGGYITAPATSASNKYGYVFHTCTIDGVGPYDLGRPWQNEPRTFFLYTTMNVLPNEGGWGPMGNLPTHFYEFNSMDADGNALDLSNRKNSPTSLNSYSPILPEEYADHFTPQNVLGGLDSWDAVATVAECEAPFVVADGAANISWEAVDGAAGYLVFHAGKFAGYTADTQYVTAEDASENRYTVAAINTNGSRGKMSSSATTGIDSLNTQAESVEYYNLQGIRVNDAYKGMVIKVTRNANGKVVNEKTIKK
ncbi:MAG: hypothetical protein K2L00_04140, partial [Muribaculaceae bacterium]|nr:hypothetical protein [Muribaculaceae bacterium]